MADNIVPHRDATTFSPVDFPPWETARRRTAYFYIMKQVRPSTETHLQKYELKFYLSVILVEQTQTLLQHIEMMRFDGRRTDAQSLLLAARSGKNYSADAVM